MHVLQSNGPNLQFEQSSTPPIHMQSQPLYHPDPLHKEHLVCPIVPGCALHLGQLVNRLPLHVGQTICFRDTRYPAARPE